MRTMRRGLAGLAILSVLVGALITAVPGLRSVAHLIGHADTSWIAIAICLEALSCLGYVLLFGRVFDDVPRGIAARLSLAELAANSVVSLSGAGGLALGAWFLRGRGMAPATIGRRSVLLFLLTSAINLGAAIVLGVGLGLGLFHGPDSWLLTFLPAALAAVLIAAVIIAGRRAQQLSDGWAAGRRRLHAVLAALGGGVHDGLRELRRPGLPLAGATAYWLMDALVLWVAFRSLGVSPPIAAVLLANLVGLLANSLPIPGGFAVVDGGLVGALLLYGCGPAGDAVAAVLIYRAISLWLPSLAGIVAFASLRGELRRPAFATAAAQGMATAAQGVATAAQGMAQAAQGVAQAAAQAASEGAEEPAIARELG